MQKFDGIFDGNNVIGAHGIDAVNHGGESGGLAAARRSRHQHHPAALFANLVNNFGQVKLFQGANLGGNHAQNHAHVSTLLENVHAEAAETGHAVGHVELGLFLELLLLAVAHHAERHVQHVFA